MPHNDRDCSYLVDMLDCCTDIVSFTSGITLQQFESDKMRKLATERQLETLGEAANHVSPGKQQEWAEIDWKRIIGLRNKLAHDYGEILAKRVWLISRQNIPELATNLKKVLSENCPDYSGQRC